MKSSILTSFCLHGLIFAFLARPSAESPSMDAPSAVELVSLGQNQSARLAKRKKKSEQKLKATNSVAKQNSESRTSSEPLQEGEHQEVVKARQAKAGSMEVAPLSYAQELQLFIEKNQFYPRRALVMEQVGEVKLLLVVDKAGYFKEVKIVQASAYNSLNQAALDLVRGLKKFKPLPSRYQKQGEFLVPINYQLGSRGI